MADTKRQASHHGTMSVTRNATRIRELERHGRYPLTTVKRSDPEGMWRLNVMGANGVYVTDVFPTRTRSRVAGGLYAEVVSTTYSGTTPDLYTVPETGTRNL